MQGRVPVRQARKPGLGPLAPTHKSINPCTARHAPVIPALGRQTQVNSGAHWPVMLARSVSCRFGERASRKGRWRVRERASVDLQPAQEHLCRQTHSCMQNKKTEESSGRSVGFSVNPDPPFSGKGRLNPSPHFTSELSLFPPPTTQLA